jgi:hypothetical protein
LIYAIVFQTSSSDRGEAALWAFWLGAFAYFAIEFWYMFRPYVKQAFGQSIQNAGGRGNFAVSPPAQAPQAYAPPPFPSGAAAPGMQKRHVGIIVVAILCFAEAGFWIIGSAQDFTKGRFENIDAVALMFVGIDSVIGYGLLKLKRWGRILKIIAVALNLGAMMIPFFTLSSSERDGSFWAVWLAIVAYSGFVLWYMLTPQVKQAFSR